MGDGQVDVPGGERGVGEVRHGDILRARRLDKCTHEGMRLSGHENAPVGGEVLECVGATMAVRSERSSAPPRSQVGAIGIDAEGVNPIEHLIGARVSLKMSLSAEPRNSDRGAFSSQHWTENAALDLSARDYENIVHSKV